MENSKETIGQRVKELRKKLKMTQAELGEVLGVGNKAVSAYEAGNAELSPAALAKIAALGRVSIDWIVTGNTIPVVVHTDPTTEREGEWLTSILPGVGELSRREEQIVKMYRYLCDHNKELAQVAYEDMVEAFLDARNAPTDPHEAGV